MQLLITTDSGKINSWYLIACVNKLLNISMSINFTLKIKKSFSSNLQHLPNFSVLQLIFLKTFLYIKQLQHNSNIRLSEKFVNTWEKLNFMQFLTTIFFAFGGTSMESCILSWFRMVVPSVPKYPALINQKRVLMQQDNAKPHTSRKTK